MSERTRGERASFGVVCGVTRAYEEIRRYDATTRREKKQTAATQLDIPSRHPLVIPSSSPSRRVTSPAAGRVPTDGGAFQRVSRVFRRPPRGIPGERVSRRRRVVGRHLGRDVSSAATTAVVSAVGAANAPVLANPTIVAARSAAFRPTIGPFFASRAAAATSARLASACSTSASAHARIAGGDDRGRRRHGRIRRDARDGTSERDDRVARGRRPRVGVRVQHRGDVSETIRTRGRDDRVETAAARGDPATRAILKSRAPRAPTRRSPRRETNARVRTTRPAGSLASHRTRRWRARSPRVRRAARPARRRRRGRSRASRGGTRRRRFAADGGGGERAQRVGDVGDVRAR